MSNGTFISKGDALWLIAELYSAYTQIDAGNVDRYVAGRRVALSAVASRLLRVKREDLHRYMIWACAQVGSGERLGALEEPAGWVRKNPA